jgi:anti-sigma regulatory factor (Ser/Thr protein kinase)
LRELALHIMDLIENGLNAGATLIELTVNEDRSANRLTITIRDNGRGIPERLINEALSPFFTTRTTRRVGLGLSLFREASRRCEGTFELKSEEGKGTEVSAAFRLDHVDLAPLGDMGSTMSCLIMGNPGVDFLYGHSVDDRTFELDTRQVKGELEGVDINEPEVVQYIGAWINESLSELGAGRFELPRRRESNREVQDPQHP